MLSTGILVRICLSTVLLASLSGCGDGSSGAPAEQQAPPPPPPLLIEKRLRILALGDSYTIGEGVQPAERWPVQLAELLRKGGVFVNDPDITARTGWTTRDLLTGIEWNKQPGPYNLVTLLIGVNNQFRGRSEDEYRAEFVSLLKKAVELADGKTPRVVVLSIPDWGATKFAEGQDRARIGAAIDRFNAINKEETKKAGAAYVDVTPISRTAEKDPTLLAADGLHPSGKMYAEWARLALPAAREALNEGKR